MRTVQLEAIRLNNIAMAHDVFWSLNNTPQWYDYPHLNLGEKTDFYSRLSDTSLPLFTAIDWYNYRTPIMPDEPEYKVGETKEYRTVKATRDSRMVALMALQVAGLFRFQTATLDQLNAMLTHVYRYAVYTAQLNPMYSIGYVWKDKLLDQWFIGDKLTVGGHSTSPGTFCPVPIIVDSRGDSIALSFHHIKHVSEYHWGMRTFEDMDTLAYAIMDRAGNITHWKWLD